MKQFVHRGPPSASATLQSTGSQPELGQAPSMSYYSNVDYSFGEPVVLSDLTSSSSLSNELAGSNVMSMSQLSNEMAGNAGAPESNQPTNSNFGLLNFNDLGIDLLDNSNYNFN